MAAKKIKNLPEATVGNQEESETAVREFAFNDVPLTAAEVSSENAVKPHKAHTKKKFNFPTAKQAKEAAGKKIELYDIVKVELPPGYPGTVSNFYLSKVIDLGRMFEGDDLAYEIQNTVGWVATIPASFCTRASKEEVVIFKNTFNRNLETAPARQPLVKVDVESRFEDVGLLQHLSHKKTTYVKVSKSNAIACLVVDIETSQPKALLATPGSPLKYDKSIRRFKKSDRVLV